jgi:hypothetical protein
MASSPTDGPAAATPSPVAFALRELITCWDQGYEALTRGDLDRVGALLDIAADHLDGSVSDQPDTPEEASLRGEALSAKGRLEHGMHSGLTGLREELVRARQGAKALKGYQQVHGHEPDVLRQA